MIKKENYDKFIFKGSLALESYFDDNNDEYLELFDKFNERLKKYHSKTDKTTTNSEYIVNELMALIEKLGKEKFIIYDDGDVEYIKKE